MNDKNNSSFKTEITFHLEMELINFSQQVILLQY